MRKSLYTLNIGNYAPEITAITYPFLRLYARKMGAEFRVITERRFPAWDIELEKLQIHDLALAHDDEWSMYLDSDALVHPETIDFTAQLPMDTVAHNGSDFAPFRWQTDEYFLRDGRHIGSCNWCAIASRWCRDLWAPPEPGLTQEEIVSRITLTAREGCGDEKQDAEGKPDGFWPPVVTAQHLISDYLLSRNIARYGLKFTTLLEVQKKVGLETAAFFFHEYTVPLADKVTRLRRTLKQWRLDSYPV
jgi:hypothetical protein